MAAGPEAAAIRKAPFPSAHLDLIARPGNPPLESNEFPDLSAAWVWPPPGGCLSPTHPVTSRRSPVGDHLSPPPSGGCLTGLRGPLPGALAPTSPRVRLARHEACPQADSSANEPVGRTACPRCVRCGARSRSELSPHTAMGQSCPRRDWLWFPLLSGDSHCREYDKDD